MEREEIFRLKKIKEKKESETREETPSRFSQEAEKTESSG
jgi:hypothetical protein